MADKKICKACRRHGVQPGDKPGHHSNPRCANIWAAYLPDAAPGESGEGVAGIFVCIECLHHGPRFADQPELHSNPMCANILPRLRPSVQEAERQLREMVNHPEHYGGDTPHEVIKCLEAWGLESDALLWNAVKYIARAGKKGAAREDLEKARWYLDRRIAGLK